MTSKSDSMKKCWDYISPPKSEEEIPGSWVACIYASKFPIYSKNKKNYTEMISVKHLTANKYYWI